MKQFTTFFHQLKNPEFEMLGPIKKHLEWELGTGETMW